MGAEGIRVEKPGAFAGALEQALACGKPCVIDVVAGMEAVGPLGNFYNLPSDAGRSLFFDCPQTPGGHIRGLGYLVLTRARSLACRNAGRIPVGGAAC